MRYNFDILETKDFTVVKTDEKEFYNLDNCVPLTEWVPKHDKNMVFGYLVSDANNLEKSVRSVYFQTEKINNNNRRFTVGKNNIMECFVNFTARKLPIVTWVNEKDEFRAPNNTDKNFKEDSLVYSLFNNSSGQTSKGNIKNEFFWMSKNQMKELSDQYGYDNLHNDARTSSDRYVYKLLFGEERIYDKLSPDAKLVLDKATELVEKSMELRQEMADDENHLDSWDAGYAQLKLVWKQYFQEEFKEFRQLYKNLEDRMRPLVYELGFLMK
jgi:hypothetical protein